MQSKKYDLRYDLVRIIAAVLVVGIHSDSLTLSATNYLGGGSWWVAAFLNSMGRAAVPLFVMLSGALILPRVKPLDFASAWGRVKNRLLVPTLLWTIIYFVWQIHWFGMPVSPQILVALWEARIGYLYYLYIAIGLYLAMPLVVKIISRHEPLYRSLFLLIPSICTYLFFPRDITRSLGVIFLWLPYLGFLLFGARPAGVVNIFTRCLLLIGAIISSCLSAYLLYLGNSSSIAWWMSGGQSYFWGHFSPTTNITTLCLWYLIMSLPQNSLKRIKDPLHYLASCSFGIYLIHPLVITFLERRMGFEIHLWSSHLIVNYLGKWALALIFSIVIVELMRKLRLSRLLLGESQNR